MADRSGDFGLSPRDRGRLCLLQSGKPDRKPTNSEFPLFEPEIVLWCLVEAGRPRAAAGEKEEIRRGGDGAEIR